MITLYLDLFSREGEKCCDLLCTQLRRKILVSMFALPTMNLGPDKNTQPGE